MNDLEDRKIIPTYILKEHSCNVGISDMSITYIQQPDSDSSPDDDYQELTISSVGAIVAEDEVLSGKEGYYYRLKTDKWAFDDSNEILDIIKDFKQRLNKITNCSTAIPEKI